MIAFFLYYNIYIDIINLTIRILFRLVENGETVLFKERFSDYEGMLPISVTRMEIKGNIAGNKQYSSLLKPTSL